ncbi:unnamed protein product, partial [Ixodes pacificus]
MSGFSRKDTSDCYIALHSYRATPLDNEYSSAELLMGRKFITSLPTVSSSLKPRLVDPQRLQKWEKRIIGEQKANYDRRPDVRERKPFRRGDVWVTDQRKRGILRCPTKSPRSYLVDTDTTTLPRNTFHLTPMRNTEVIKETSVPDI